MTEGVLLAHALVARLADQVGARVLFIKGPSAVAVGARPDRPSTDVDVLVDPASFDEVCQALESNWTRRFAPLPVVRTADLSFDHSAHFIRADWPSDLDIHFNFPGFLADPRVVFEALWAHRTTISIAGRDVSTPDLLGQFLVVALHALRDPYKPNSRADLRHLERRCAVLSSTQRVSLLELARQTGSLETAARVLPRTAGGPSADRNAHPGRLAAWRVRQDFGAVPGALWLVELRRTPWRHRPRAFWRAVVPASQVLVSPHLADTTSGTEIAVLHVRRWIRGLRALPRAARIVRRRLPSD